MQPIFVSKHVILDFSNPLQRDPNKRQQQQTHAEPQTPKSNTKQPHRKSPFGLSWERDPYNPYKFLEPPQLVAKNQMFAVEFRMMFNDEERVYLIAYFYARLQPDNKLEYPLACERVRTGRLHRVPLYLADAGVYSLEIVIVPDNKSYRPAVYRHEKDITVFESEYKGVHVGPYDHRRLLGFDKPKRIDQASHGGDDFPAGTDVDYPASTSAREEYNITMHPECNGNSTTNDIQRRLVLSQEALEPVDDIKYLAENTAEDYLTQWLDLNLQPANSPEN